MGRMPVMPSIHPDHRTLALEIAAAEDVDPRSVGNRLEGKHVRGPAGRRIDAALAKRGIVPPKCESRVATPGLAEHADGTPRHVDYGQNARRVQAHR
jgi:hypothetical protein